MSTEDFKGYLRSRTLWALFVAFAAMIAQHFGYTIDDAEQAKFVDLIFNAVELGGVALAAIFRVKATKKLGKPKQ